jgi:hypothetical protein
MYLPVKVMKAFKPGEEGKIKYEDGKEATIDAKRSKDCVMMDEAALQTYDNMIKLNDCESSFYLYSSTPFEIVFFRSINRFFFRIKCFTQLDTSSFFSCLALLCLV